jgi:predicted  nucleic acid-binding Zn-ribbon protein
MAIALRIMWKLLKESIDRERARADKAEADYDKLSREFIDRLIPAGASSQQTLADMAAELRRAADEIRALRDRDRRR